MRQKDSAQKNSSVKKTVNQSGKDAARTAGPQISSRPGSIDFRARRRFPESSSTSRQLQLLLAGSMPLLR